MQSGFDHDQKQQEELRNLDASRDGIRGGESPAGNMLVKLGPWPFPKVANVNRTIEEDADLNLESASNRYSMTDMSMQEGHPDLVRIGSRINERESSNVGAENNN